MREVSCELKYWGFFDVSVASLAMCPISGDTGHTRIGGYKKDSVVSEHISPVSRFFALTTAGQLNRVDTACTLK